MNWIAHIEHDGPKSSNYAAVAVGNRIYSFGGYCPGQSKVYQTMDVHVFDTNTFEWFKHPISNLPYLENDDILPYQRYGHTAIAYKDKIYIWGGTWHNGTSSSVLFYFDTVWNCWSAPKVTGDVPPNRHAHSACVWKNYMYIMGGVETKSKDFLNTVYAFDLDKMHWSYICTTGQQPSVRCFHTATCIDNKMYIFGGWRIGDDPYNNTLWYLDLNSSAWHKPKITGNIPCGRRSHSTFIHNKKMYIFGGYTNILFNEYYNDMYEFDPQILKWKRVQVTGNGPQNRLRQACVKIDNKVFLFGGVNYGLTQHDDDFCYNDVYVLKLVQSSRILENKVPQSCVECESSIHQQASYTYPKKAIQRSGWICSTCKKPKESYGCNSYHKHSNTTEEQTSRQGKTVHEKDIVDVLSKLTKVISDQNIGIQNIVTELQKMNQNSTRLTSLETEVKEMQENVAVCKKHITRRRRSFSRGAY